MSNSNDNSKKNKHLTIEDRLTIQEGLTLNHSFKLIAQDIGKDPTTVSKEVKRNLTLKHSDVTYFGLDETPIERPRCPKLNRAPFVCNGCSKRRKCSLDKQYYYAKDAQKRYEELISISREGTALNSESFYEMDEIISREIKEKGSHLYQIVSANDFDRSLSSIYRYFDKGYLSVNKLDLPRAVKFRPRKVRKDVPLAPKYKINHTYDDFRDLVEVNGLQSWVEMDTVMGRQGGKCLLTILWTSSNFMIGRLLDDHSALQVVEKIRDIREALKDAASFGEIAPVILTDNGSEFNYFNEIQKDLDGKDDCTVFFCQPYASYEKPRVEKNHTLLRDILPKGTSFDDLTQKDVDVIFSHINSVARKSFNGKSAYDLFTFVYGEKIASLLGITKIPGRDVVQSPVLLKKLRSK